jgi:hypothetical protein
MFEAFSWFLLLSWLLMYHMGLLTCIGLSFTYFNFTNARYPRLKALLLSAVWFITFPIFGCYTLWKRRPQIQTLSEQLKAFQQMQEQFAAMNQLSASMWTAPEGEKVDPSYEQ